MKRRLFNAGAVVSLALCLAVFVLWVQSYSEDCYMETHGPFGVSSCESSVCLTWTFSPGGSGATIGSTSDDSANLYRFRCFIEKNKLPGWTTLHLEFPHWALLLLTLPLPAAWVASYRRRLICGGVCPACGYDLRGTPGSECPECGAEREAGNA